MIWLPKGRVRIITDMAAEGCIAPKGPLPWATYISIYDAAVYISIYEHLIYTYNEGTNCYIGRVYIPITKSQIVTSSE